MKNLICKNNSIIQNYDNNSKSCKSGNIKRNINSSNILIPKISPSRLTSFQKPAEIPPPVLCAEIVSFGILRYSSKGV